MKPLKFSSFPSRLFFFFFLFLFHVIMICELPSAIGATPALRMENSYGKLPLSFEENKWQTDSRVRFLSRGSGYALFLTPEEAVLKLRKSEGNALEKNKGKLGGKPVPDKLKADRKTIEAVIRMRLKGANASPSLKGEDKLPGVSNYFQGNDSSKWRKGVSNFARVRYREVYPGIDLVFYGNQRRLEYDFILKPGTDPCSIRIAFQGADRMKLDEKGNLILQTKNGDIIQKAPSFYQEKSGKKIHIDGQYHFFKNGDVGFQVASWDQKRDLVIDPVIVYSTYLGGSDYDSACEIAVDSRGNAYIAGRTGSTDFPTYNALNHEIEGNNDVFIIKLNPDGTQILYSTYLGGRNDDSCYGLTVDESGNAFVTGSTESMDFPSINAVYPNKTGDSDAFILKLNSVGDQIIFSTYLGGGAWDCGYGIAVDRYGNAYVTGATTSFYNAGIYNFPEINPIYTGLSGSVFTFIFKLSADGTQAIYSTGLGGSEHDYGFGIAVDESENVYVTGLTWSSDFPTENAIYPDSLGSPDAFIFKLNGDGDDVVYSTYLSGSMHDVGWGIATDSLGNAYVTGYTGSSDFPTVNAIYPYRRGDDDAFIFKLNADGSQVFFSTFIGGMADDWAEAITVDVSENIYITGQTLSINFPTVDALYEFSYPNNQGGSDPFIFKLSADGNQALFSTYLRGSGSDCGEDIAVDDSGNIYVAGFTYSSDFPTVNPIYPNLWGQTDAFIVKISDSPALNPVIAQTPMSGPPGATFTQWATGFTPDGVAALHFKKPDGTEYPSHNQSLDSQGHFEVEYTSSVEKPAGSYIWWAVDVTTGIKSNEVNYTIENSMGDSSLEGTIYDESGTPLNNVSIDLGVYSTTSNADGEYFFSSISDGVHDLILTKTGYATENDVVYIPAKSKIIRNYQLNESSGIQIVSLKSKYPDNAYFLDGVSFHATYTAVVDWAGRPPGYVRFITPEGSFHVPTSSNTASREFDMGYDFGPCEKLKAIAVSGDGASSEEKTADFTVMSPLPFTHSFLTWFDFGDGFCFEDSLGLINVELFDEGVDRGVIPSNIPVFGSEKFGLQFVPTLNVKADSDGSAEYELDFDNFKLAEGEVAGFPFTITPELGIDGQFSSTACQWNWDGYFGLKGEIELKKSQHFFIAAGPVIIPTYLKVAVQVSTEFLGSIASLDPISMNGNLILSPYVRGSVGCGFDETIAVEGWIGGGASLGLQWPDEPTMDELTLYVNAGLTAYALLWEWEHEGLRWDWDYYQQDKSSTFSEKDIVPEPKLIAREYLKNTGRTEFGKESESVIQRSSRQGQSPVSLTSLQSSAFPYSEASVSSAGDHFYLAWLQDDAQRSSVNRTETVFSSWDGASWSDPQVVHDDGTADFHPEIIVFSSGSALLAWENQKIAHPDTAVFEDMVENLEIAFASYDGTVGTWNNPTQLTSNPYLDRSPKLAGNDSDDVLLTWIANPDNNLMGTSTEPNQIWSAFWNGSGWEAEAMACEIPHGIIKYDSIYDGENAYIVFSLDTDNNIASVNDRDLYLLEYASGTWKTLERLTDNSVPDDNPQMAEDTDGHIVLTWLQEGNLASLIDFEFNKKRIIKTDDFSSNLADFKMASSADGKLSVIWAEPSDYSSDIFSVFYDPSLNSWSGDRQLTMDQETERNIVAAFHGEDHLIVIYSRNQIEITEIKRRTLADETVSIKVPEIIATDLFMLKHTLGEDLALESESLKVLPENPLPGSQAVLSANAQNLGDISFSNIPVAFYNGDPAAGGVEIGQEVIFGAFSPGDEKTVSMHWDVPQTEVPLEIFAVIDPDAAFDPSNRSNNLISRRFVKADLGFQLFSWTRLTGDELSVTVRIKNTGAISADAATVKFFDENGILIHEGNIDSLGPGESADINFLWDVASLKVAEYKINVVVDDENMSDEFDESNNNDAILIPVQNFFVSPCNGNAPCFQTIQEACEHVGSVITVKITEGNFTESITASVNETFILEGGWNADFSTQNSYTAIHGDVEPALTIRAGTVIAENVILK